MYIYNYVYVRKLPGFINLSSRIDNASCFSALKMKEATAFTFKMHNDSCEISCSHSSVGERYRRLRFYAV